MDNNKWGRHLLSTCKTAKLELNCELSTPVANVALGKAVKALSSDLAVDVRNRGFAELPAEGALEIVV